VHSGDNVRWTDLGQAADGTRHGVLEFGGHEIVFTARCKSPTATGEPPFVPTEFQRRILLALDGRALIKQQLANEVCDGHGKRLYRSGLTELKARGIVGNKRGAGIYRPDRPPKDW